MDGGELMTDEMSWIWSKALIVHFPGGSMVKNPAESRRCGFLPWMRKIPWRRKWEPLQYSGLENPSGRGAWGAKSMGLLKRQI